VSKVPSVGLPTDGTLDTGGWPAFVTGLLARISLLDHYPVAV
jgi:hypothetical protein